MSVYFFYGDEDYLKEQLLDDIKAIVFKDCTKYRLQNEELTFRTADRKDWWFHVKGMPGSHVIVKSGEKELPDRVYEEAGMLAAFYSSATPNEKVEVDYTLRKNLKKPAGSRPGLVIYHTNYSLIATAKKPNFMRVYSTYLYFCIASQ